ncbi:hypothetical protein BOTNAR_0233g00080 [Botryotinia narcissicola]|uniref:Uncharacterized protein n=1 Tax=Botryotinia narcissicola TaxID=278944 RepID=A0A4Z1IH59_9HELO|nr:hypothetical protein BOTNAR_0233g00080 [Botryotinia narcissicola]
MVPNNIRVIKAIVAVTLLSISGWTAMTMDLKEIVAQQQPFIESGIIEWTSGSVPIIDHFFPIEIFNRIWRGTMATFSPSTLGYDEVALWQIFSFLIDLGPLYTIFLLESFRPANTLSPAYFNSSPTIFTCLAQFSGIGIVAPFFLFLCLVFGPGAHDLAKFPPSSRTVRHNDIWTLLSVVLLLHTVEVFVMFLATDLTTRHYWTWAWQASPLWIGIAVTVSSSITKDRISGAGSFASLRSLLVILGAISTAFWLFTLTSSPFPIATVFLPRVEVQSDFVFHTRKALQADEVGTILAAFLWLIFSFYNLHIAGLLDDKWLLYSITLPVATIFAGPGTALIIGWYLKEITLKANSIPKISYRRS